VPRVIGPVAIEEVVGAVRTVAVVGIFAVRGGFIDVGVVRLAAARRAFAEKNGDALEEKRGSVDGDVLVDRGIRLRNR